MFFWEKEKVEMPMMLLPDERSAWSEARHPATKKRWKFRVRMWERNVKEEPFEKEG